RQLGGLGELLQRHRSGRVREREREAQADLDPLDALLFLLLPRQGPSWYFGIYAAMKTMAHWLSEPVMGFLALAALSTGLAPQLFLLPPGFERALAAVEWAIIALF